MSRISATVQDLFDYFFDAWEKREEIGRTSAKQVKQYRNLAKHFIRVVPSPRGVGRQRKAVVGSEFFS